MPYRMSPNVAVRTTDPAGAVRFYSEILGFAIRSDSKGVTELDAAPTTLFVIADDEVAGPVHELFVDDLDAARDELLAHGCEIVRWHGRGQDCYVRDPYGTIFNLWEGSG